MSTPSRWILVAALLAVCFLFLRLGELPLVDPDEGRNAAVALEMSRGHEWLIPTLNGIPYLDKPALYFRMVAGSLGLVGRDGPAGRGEAAARLPSALAGVALLALLYLFGRREYGRRTAVLILVVTASTPLVVIFARMVIFDLPLALCTTAAILAAFHAERQVGRRRTGWHLVATVGTALGTLLKGPVGFLIPGLVLLVHFAWERRSGVYQRLLSPLNFALFLALTLPWFFAVQARQPDFAHYGLVEETFRRYGTGAFHRSGPFWYYGPVIAATFFPWSLLLPVGVRVAWERRHRLCPTDRLFLVWAVVVVLFFSTSRSKLPGYVLSGVIAAAVLTARLLAAAWWGDEASLRRRVAGASGWMAGVAATLAIILLTAAHRPEATERLLRIHSAEWERARSILTPAGITLALVALAAGIGGWRRRPGFTLAAGPLFLAGLLTLCFPGIQRYAEASSSRGLAAAVPAGADVLCLECFPPGLPFYLERPVHLLTEDGRETTSNYIAYRLRSGAERPGTLLRPSDLPGFVGERRAPLFLIAKRRGRARLDSLATANGGTVFEIRRAWWGLRLPAPEGR